MANLARELMFDWVPNTPQVEVVKPIQAADTVYQGLFVTEDTSYRVGTFATTERFAGVVKHSVDNSTGAAAAAGKDVKVVIGGFFRYYIASTTQADIGKSVFVGADDNSLSLTPRLMGLVGKIIANNGSGLCTIYMDPATVGRDQWQTFFDIADDGTVALPAQDAIVEVAGGGEYGIVKVTSAGAVSLVGYTDPSDAGCLSSNFDIADTDAKLCVYDAGANATIKNRLAATKRIFVTYHGLPTA